MNKNYTYTKICCYIGYFVQAIINNFLPLIFVTFNENYGMSYEKIGALVLINFCTQIFTDVTSIFFIKRLGYKKCAVFAHILAALGLICLCVLPLKMQNTYIAVVISVLIYAYGSGLIEVIISPIVEYLPTKNKSAQMCLLHSFYCWGQLLTVLITLVMFTFIGGNRWYFMPLIWAAVPVLNSFAFMRADVVEPPEEHESSGKAKNPMLKNKMFYLFFVIMLCAGAAEVAVAQWASAFAQQGLGFGKAAGDIFGPCMFALLMGVGRLIYGIFGEKFNLNKVMIAFVMLCIVCYIVLGFSNNAVLSLVFCALCGFSVSIMWPGTLSMAAADFKTGGAALFGLLAAAGDIGCSAGPYIAGVAASAGGLKAGFRAAMVFPVAMLVCCMLLVLAKRAKKY